MYVVKAERRYYILPLNSCLLRTVIAARRRTAAPRQKYISGYARRRHKNDTVTFRKSLPYFLQGGGSKSATFGIDS